MTITVIKTQAAYQAIRRSLVTENITIGFVPTMGNLHQGHASLLKRSKSENDVTVLSIFVNQTQFNQQEDYENYQRTIDEDIALAEALGVDIVFIPEYADIYPDDYRFKVVETDFSTQLEGEHRPGHFDGVLTVVMKLLLLIKPHCLYLGEKDYQQYQLIKEMANAFFLDIDIRLCKTIRDDKGLAHSSRNNRLTPLQLEQARMFPKILKDAPSCEKAVEWLNENKFQVDYVKEYMNRRYGAVYLGAVRLIDNIECKS